jgi:hypothetical protein
MQKILIYDMCGLREEEGPFTEEEAISRMKEIKKNKEYAEFNTVLRVDVEEEIKLDTQRIPTHLKVYIAGKVNGLPDYKKYFNAAQYMLTSFGCLCMNPGDLPEGFPYDSYLPICYAMIDACDAIFLLKNWKDSNGANLEYKYAKEKGKLIIFEEYISIQSFK